MRIALHCESTLPQRVRTAVRTTVRAALLREAAGDVYLSVVLTDAKTIRALNRRYRGKDKATNVLSFPGTGRPPTPRSKLRDIGEILVCPAYAAKEAEDAGMDPEVRLAHVLVHGTLHLLGYDHETSPRAQREMEQKEAKILDALPQHVYHALSGAFRIT